MERDAGFDPRKMKLYCVFWKDILCLKDWRSDIKWRVIHKGEVDSDTLSKM